MLSALRRAICWALARPMRRIGLLLLSCVLLVAAWVGYSVFAFFSTVYTHNGSIASMAWSPDGEDLAVLYRQYDESNVGPTSVLEVISWKQGSRPIVKYHTESSKGLEIIDDLKWSLDGTALAGLMQKQEYRGISVINLTAKQPDFRYIFGETEPGCFVWVPGNKMALPYKRNMLLHDHSSNPGTGDKEIVYPQEMPMPLWEIVNSISSVRPVATGLFHVSLAPGNEKIVVEEHNDNAVHNMVSVQNLDKDHKDPGIHSFEIKAAGDSVLSPDGKMLALCYFYRRTSGELASIDLWDLEKRTKVQTLILPASLVPRDESRESNMREYRLCDNITPLDVVRSCFSRDPLAPYRFSSSRVKIDHSLAWSKDGKRFAGAFYLVGPEGGFPSRVLLVWWNAETGAVLARKEVALPRRLLAMRYVEDYIPNSRPLCWSPDLSKLALGMELLCVIRNTMLVNAVSIQIIPAPTEAR